MSLDPITNPAAACIGVPILLLFVFAAFAFYAFNEDQQTQRARKEHADEAFAAAQVDAMSNRTFRLFVITLLAKRGYTAHIPNGQDDLGTELIADKDAQRYSVQAIHYGKVLTPQSVQLALANRARFGCNNAMVITNATFHSDAQQLAQKEGCTLIDRHTLAEWVAFNPANTNSK